MLLIRPVLAASAGVLLLSLAACGGGDDATATGGAVPEGQQGQQGQQAQQAGQGTGRVPGASGLVADISGKTLQVQSQDSQTAVTYTDATTFTAQVAAKLADVTVGSCVQVMAPQDGSTPSASSTPPSAITAATVRITPATDGSCTRGGFGGGTPGDRPSGMPTDLPSNLPTDRPSGAPSGRQGGGGFGAFGQVSAVSATGFTVAEQAFGQDAQAQTTDVTVTVSADTTYTTTKDATASALAVGKCVSAMGQADDTGSVTAQRITISDAVDGQCTGGFGGFPGGFGRPGASSQGAGQ